VKTNETGYSARYSTVSRAPSGPMTGSAIRASATAPTPAATSESSVAMTTLEPSSRTASG